MSYIKILTNKEKGYYLISLLPWKLNKFCPSYIKEFIFTCKKVIKLKGELLPIGRGIQIQLSQLWYFLRLGSTDFLVFDQVVLNGEYSPLLKIVSEKISTEKILTVIDAGANVGFSSIMFSKYFKNAQIVSLEPDLLNYESLVKNISLNQKNAEIIPLRAGLWGFDTTMVMDNSFSDGREWSYRLKEPNLSDIKSERVEAFCISTLIKKFDIEFIDILKIDIEGGEKNLFDELAKDISVLKFVRFIALEIHDELANREFINGLLAKNNFKIFEIGETTFGVNESFI